LIFGYRKDTSVFKGKFYFLTRGYLMAQWFGPKEPGFEMGIRSWQGWVVIAVFLVAMIGTRFLPFDAWGLPRWVRPVTALGLILLFAPLFYFNYERD
jgi:hypothetical protein